MFMQRKDMTTATSNETELLQRAQGRDVAAFAELYDRYYGRVYSHVAYRLVNAQDAEDVVQQVFLRAWQSIHRYQGERASFATWLFTIAHRRVIDHYRARKVEPLILAEEQDPRSSRDMAEVIHQRMEAQQLRQTILRLPQVQQTVIWLRFLEGFDYREIAAVLNKSEGAVRVLQFRALARLRHLLEGSDNHE